jgi:hypothetical protein
MPDNGAQMYTFQLDSEAAEKVNDGHYKVSLSPSLQLPLLAEPQAMVRSVVFSNSFANVQSRLYQNATVDVEWHPDASASGSDPVGSSVTATATLTIPNGYYTLEALQLELARQVFATQMSDYKPDQATPIVDPTTHEDMNRLWHYMNKYVTRPPKATDTYKACSLYDTAVWQYDSALATYLYFGTPTTSIAVSALEGASHLGITAAEVQATNKKGSPHVLLWFQNILTASFEFKPSKAAEITDITGVTTAATGFLTTTTVKQVTNKYYKQGSSEPTGRGDVFVLLTLSSPLTVNVPHNTTITLAVDASRRGLAVGHLGVPELQDNSDLGIALKMEECMAINHATYNPAMSCLHTIPVLTVGTTHYNQSQRSVFPFYLRQDPGTGAVQFLSAVPDVKIRTTSTLFTKMLGYDGTLGTFESDQDSTLVRSGYSHAQPFTATATGKVSVARAVQVHVPTIVASTYDREGRLQGNQMAQIPIPVGTLQNEYVSWQAATPYYVPCQMYGSSLDSIEFYLTNENNEPLDLQVSQFAVTMTIGWASPAQPALGSADAEDLVQDIKAAYRRF